MQLTLISEPGRNVSAGALPPGAVARPIEEADLDRLGHLYWASYPRGEVGTLADAVADVQASWDGEYGRWVHDASLLVEEEGAPVAAVLVVDRPPWPDVSDLVFIIDIFTDAGRRGRGFAAHLMAASLSAVDPARAVGLRVESENAAAVRLYDKLGFRLRP